MNKSTNSGQDIDKAYFEGFYSTDGTAGYQPIYLDEQDPVKTLSKDGLWKTFNPYDPTAKQKFKHFRATPKKVLENAHVATEKLWERDKEWACSLLDKAVPSDLAISLFAQYAKRWESYVLQKQANPTKKSRTNQSNVWLRKRINMVKHGVAAFPVSLDNLKYDGLRKSVAQMWADKCMAAIVEEADKNKNMDEAYQVVKLFSDQWGFTVKTPAQTFEPLENESDEDYSVRIINENAGFRLTRLIDEVWWLRKINIAYRRFCEHCQILNGRARQGVSLYLSDVGLRDFRFRKAATKIALSKMVARNEETGDEINMLEAFNTSVSNPAIRRHELMVRMRGFQDIAEENKLISGFFTLTAPSQYHGYKMSKDKKCSRENTEYKGFTPTETQQYLSAIWAKARAALKRLNIPFFGFRVCEPHHDETPHWHALFFFKPEHEQVIRYMLAEYFTQADRHELNVDHGEFKDWYNLAIGKSDDGRFIKTVDADVANNMLSDISSRIKRRFLYKRMDPSKGGATGYIAKYIAKNIDGYKMEDDENSNTTADRNAEAACGWASTWGIRQFQQIGGPSVSVWRELRRLPQDEQVKEEKAAAKDKGKRYQPKIRAITDLKNEEHDIEVARIAADSNNWGMFIHAMGGLFATRDSFPIRMVYKPVVNAYGETVNKLKGVGSFDKTMITHSDDWVITKVGEESHFDLEERQFRPWSSVNNCTEDENITVESVITDQFKLLGVERDDYLLDPVMQGSNILTGMDVRHRYLIRI
ncbi:replication endonuclease [Psychromonas antarctica]|uniref:replication endonuclease n=1 Tax=Psychromonas antarctica TaxID=67573 RepID=UPI001EE9AB18|nr:replication endonuclease [Psychromonas antarctica]MCG6202812.1 replication endonuclease [Psychromonas antarctica]